MTKGTRLVAPKAAPTKIPDAELRRQTYNKAVREAHLVTILLSSLKFDVSRDALGSDENCKLRYAHDLADVEISSRDGSFALIVRVNWRVELKQGRKRIVQCSALYDIVYDEFSELDEDIGNLLAENLAQPATYAYFRALFANLDWSAGLQTPPLPVIKFFPKA